MAQRKLEDLAPQECVELLTHEEVGRLVYVDDDGPAAVPVNFAMDGHRVVVRIEHGPRESLLQGPVAFEVDRVDPTDHSGWSVLVRATARTVPLSEVPDLLHRIGGHFPRPWAAGVHSLWLTLEPIRTTGKRFGAPVVI